MSSTTKTTATPESIGSSNALAAIDQMHTYLLPRLAIDAYLTNAEDTLDEYLGGQGYDAMYKAFSDTIGAAGHTIG